MKPTILFYAPAPTPWGGQLRQLCAIQGFRLRVVETQDLDRTVEVLAQGLQTSQPHPAGAPLEEPVLVFCALSGKQFDRLLPALTRMGARSCLKAVLTAHNARWSFRDLYAELVKERLQLS
ncbi:DUF3783 domain-containing protein [Vermiculatibacterium agrestimuris]|uniref:DUF3783 domain-containing protein n=1 Tax=Vermiculatibacterium agrestimuris TaxID=2941519 RepID=UPI0020416E34|nr:DUF3783 domain-containing protein [Vermiculatibacterium agrestimuris]